MTAPPPRRWDALTCAEFAALDKTRLVAVLPLAATEQHGAHLPLSTDADLAQAMLHAAERFIPDDVPALFLPIQRLGHSPEHADFPGTLSISAASLLHSWNDLAAAVAASGIRKMILFSTHGGNNGLIETLAFSWRQSLKMQVVSVHWERLPLGDAGNRFDADERRFGIHAGRIETAMMLAAFPEKVHLDKAENHPSATADRAAKNRVLGHGARLAWTARDLHPAGTVGNAAAADAAEGAALLEAIGQSLAQLIAETSKLPPLRSASTATRRAGLRPAASANNVQ